MSPLPLQLCHVDPTDPPADGDVPVYNAATKLYKPTPTSSTGNVTAASTLTSNQVVIGQGSNAVATLGSLGTTTTVLHGNAAGAPSFAAVVEADITLADNTTNNVATTKHGLAPKLPNDATKYLDGTGNYTVPAGTGGFTSAIYVHLREEQAQNTAGGTFSSGAWRTRVLNTEVNDVGGLCSLASNQFTLTAGTYIISASAPAYLVNARHQLRVQNVTDTATVLVGQSNYAPTIALNTVMTYAQLNGMFTIAASKALELQHICQSTETTDGFGVAANFTTEVYSVVELWKVG